MKKVLALFLSVVMLICSVPVVQVSAVTAEDSLQYLTYSIANGEVTVTDCDEGVAEIVIPDTIEGYPVTGIGEGAFMYCTSLTSLSIPDSVTVIGYSAFYRCTRLAAIDIPDGVELIDDSVFNYCRSLTSVTIPEGVRSIGDSAFSDCSRLTEVIIPDSVSVISSWAFQNCIKLTSVELPEKITFISKSLFAGCTGLTEVYIPAAVTSIRAGAFGGCSVLDTVYFGGTEAQWGTVSIDSTSNTPLLSASVICSDTHDCVEVEISAVEATCTEAGATAGTKCSVCNKIITAPEEIEALGHSFVDGSCSRCGELDDTVEYESGAWRYKLLRDGIVLTEYLGSATDVYVPGKLTVDGEDLAVIKLGDDLFNNNDALNSVTLGEGIAEIGARVFYDCDNLVCIVTNEQLTTIGDEAFYSCDSFNSIILYNAVTSIGTNTFANCPELTIWCNYGSAGYNYAVANSIDYEIFNPDTTPETYVENGVTYYIMNGEAVAIAFDESTTEVTIPATVNGYPVTEIIGAFNGCSEITSVILPEGLKVIGNYTFKECSLLAEIELPESLVSIGEYAFASCSALTSISIPDSVTSIGFSTFN
ncbi:MAG: leucine-rich repeat domain-containing protein, partial [Clostridia bacterium]|nr:leucine-rich repeat domain-containing protein [Clostridia bacterium]